MSANFSLIISCVTLVLCATSLVLRIYYDRKKK